MQFLNTVIALVLVFLVFTYRHDVLSTAAYTVAILLVVLSLRIWSQAIALWLFALGSSGVFFGNFLVSVPTLELTIFPAKQSPNLLAGFFLIPILSEFTSQSKSDSGINRSRKERRAVRKAALVVLLRRNLGVRK